MEELSNKHACIGECVTSVHEHLQWHTNKANLLQFFYDF